MNCTRLIGLLIAAGLAVAIGGPETRAQATNPVKIGLTTALTGPYSEFGVSQKNVVEIAIEQANARGGVKGRPVVLVSYDDGLVPARAQSNMRRLLEEDKVDAVIAPAGSGPALAVAPLVVADNVVMMTTIAQTTLIAYPNGMENKPYPQVFTFSLLNKTEAEVISTFVGKRYKKIGLLGESTTLGQEQLDFTTAMLKEKYDLTPVDREQYTQQDPDMTAQIARLQRAEADVIVLVGIAADAAVIKKGLNRLGFKGALVGSLGVQSQPFKELAGDLVIGAMGTAYNAFADFSTAPPPAHELAAAYLKKFGNDRYYGPNRDPIAYFGVTAASYDGANVLLQAMDRAASLKTEAIIAELESGKPFPAARTTYTFSASRHHAVTADMLGIYEYVKAGDQIVIKKAE
jgi:branched-chain amino acid transport system substrate-binding protein